jgi:hypothetical protein
MGTTLNRSAYERLIEEDLEWLMRQPRSLEREHIADIVRVSPDREYGPPRLSRMDKARVDVVLRRRLDNFRELGADEWRTQYARDVDTLVSLLTQPSVPGATLGVGADDCASAICRFCASPSYGPAEKIEGSERWWHLDLNNREYGVQPCAAGPIRDLQTRQGR